MIVIEFGIFTIVKLLNAKALLHIVVTLLGISTEIKFFHQKALYHILDTFTHHISQGMITFFGHSLEYPHIVHVSVSKKSTKYSSAVGFLGQLFIFNQISHHLFSSYILLFQLSSYIIHPGSV